MRGGFDSLAHDLHAEGVAEMNDRLKDGQIAAGGGGGDGEPRIEFDDVDGQAGEQVERGQVRSEVVYSNAHIAIDHALQNGYRRVRILVQRGLGNLEEQAGRVYSSCGQSHLQLGNHVGVIELALGDIDGQGEIALWQLLGPLMQLPAYRLDRLAAEADGEACVFGYGK